MKALEWLVIGLIAYTVIYMILKAIEINHKYKEIQQPTQKSIPKQIEIKSRDLHCKAENLIQTHEVYALQVDQIVMKINKIEDALEAERQSYIRSDSEIESLVTQSLRLQEQKCKIESKMLKICDALDEIAQEEYKRQIAL